MAYDADSKASSRLSRQLAPTGGGRKLITYAAALGFVVLAVPAGWIIERLTALTAVPLVFFAAVLAAAVLGGVGEALFATVASYLAYVALFGGSAFAIQDISDIVTMAYFLAVAVVVGFLGARLRSELDLSRRSARRADLLQNFIRRASAAKNEQETAEAIVDLMRQAMNTDVALLQHDATGAFHAAASHPPMRDIDLALRTAAAGCWRARERVGWSTAHVPDLPWLIVPLVAREVPVALLVLRRPRGAVSLSAMDRVMLDTLADQALVALERARLIEINAEAQNYRETERLRAALLSSVSHDLRTPLASIVGAATTLQSLGDRLSDENRITLADTIAGESRRLNRYIQNLLDMSRLDHGAIRAEAEWVDLRDTVSAAEKRLRDAYTGRQLARTIPDEHAFVFADPTLLEQILVNILDNAAKYSPPDRPVRIEAGACEGSVVLSVTDEGPGVDPEKRERIFEPFQRGDAGDRSVGGTGLGLSIARGFARAMGGDVLLRDAADGPGARFEVVLPRTKRPALDGDEDGPPPTVHT